MSDGGNSLVAERVDSTTWFSGIGIAESVDMIVTGVEDGSWVDGVLGGVGTVAESAVWVLDPVGALVTAGFGWCVEHIEPLSQALDWLAGDPDQVAANAQTWHNVAVEHAGIADLYNRAVAHQIQDWDGPAATAYRHQANETLNLLVGLTRAAEGMKAIVAMSGSVVALVRTLVRDLIGELVSILLARLPLWTAETVGTLGIAAPYVVAQVTALVAKWGARITRLLRALTASLRNLMPALHGLDEAIGAITAVLVRRGGGLPHSGSPAPEIRWGGAGYADTPQTARAGELYEKIRARTDDVDSIADLLGIPRYIVERVKNHVFVETHDVPVDGQVVHGRFAPMAHIADWWDKAAADKLPFSKEVFLKRLLVHEYVESHLMAAGMPYVSLDVRAATDSLDPVLFGAHHLAPRESALMSMFGHWATLGKQVPDIAMADDLSNIEEILQIVLREMP
ncbi:WXG100 family type VII secretion target [Catellatospora sp. KI3]|uniref:WXG100 family type VII secretion target n=1 Tax=Catellatospora sp. KI3 TaxID=3041620 RepID=UPI0024822E90|nr:WXG100 family type VII secretion target [Catellatospora sp. KI3]MDI1460614.1 WXG100 family type VII secretion target [Catellatospora sp. KI3]